MPSVFLFVKAKFWRKKFPAYIKETKNARLLKIFTLRPLIGDGRLIQEKKVPSTFMQVPWT